MGANSRKARKRWLLIWAQEGRCAACGGMVRVDAPRLHQDEPTLDHVIPKADGGPDALSNLLVKHRRCNERRADRSPTQLDFQWLSTVQARLPDRPATPEDCRAAALALLSAQEAA